MSDDELKSWIERHFGDSFIAWLNEQRGLDFNFKERAGEAPDLVYSSGATSLYLEVTVAYGPGWAKFQHEGIRKLDTAATRHEADGLLAQRLAKEVMDVLTKKSRKRYGRGCVLVIGVDDPFVNPPEFEEVLPQVEVPKGHDFDGIYALHQQKNVEDRDYPPGIRVYPLLPMPYAAVGDAPT